MNTSEAPFNEIHCKINAGRSHIEMNVFTPLTQPQVNSLQEADELKKNLRTRVEADLRTILATEIVVPLGALISSHDKIIYTCLSSISAIRRERALRNGSFPKELNMVEATLLTTLISLIGDEDEVNALMA